MEAIAQTPPHAVRHTLSPYLQRAAAPVGLHVRPLAMVLSSNLPRSLRMPRPLTALSPRGKDCADVGAVLLDDELDAVLTTSTDPVDEQHGDSLLMGVEAVEEQSPLASTPGGFSPDPPFSFELSSVAATSSSDGIANEVQVLIVSTPVEVASTSIDTQFVDRAINATIVGAAGAFAIAKILTVDHDYWHGWTIFEILRYAPLHNWSAYEEALKTNPVLAKMMISGVVYAVGDWIAQCYEGKPILEISRKRMIRSGLVGFCLHGSLSHFYYHICEALFPFKDWWVVPVKVAFDQTIWSAFWNSVYFVTLGLLRLESPVSIAAELRATFWPMLTAGWKLWPFAHLITYGAVPVEQRLLWVDCVELVWVTILSMYSNEKAEERIHGENLRAVPEEELAASGELE